MTTEPLPPAYVISLAGGADRRTLMTERLGAAGIAFSFFDAIDGRGFDVESQAVYDGPARRAKYGHGLIGGEIGCLLSHRAVLRIIAEADKGPALVFEDDVVLSPDFAKVVSALMQRQDRWELVRFQGSKKVMGQRQRPILDLGGGYWMTRLWSTPGGAHAYLVSPSGARKLLRWLDRTPFPIDNLMGRPWKTGVGNFTVRPGMAVQDKDLESAIGDARFVSPEQVRRGASLGRRISMGLHKLGDNFATRLTYWAKIPEDFRRRQVSSAGK